MNRIVKNIENIMTGRAKSSPSILEFILTAMSVAFGAGLKLRQSFYCQGILRPRRLPCSVISVGNLTVGGTGKTPMTMHVAKLVRQLGYNVVVMSRGYKGRAEKTSGLVSDGREIFMGPEAAGDEPYMIAKRLEDIPVVVGKNRYKTGMRVVEKFSPDVLVLDDAFQHLRLFRNIDLVLLDGRRPFANQHLLPRGILREPISALMRSDAVIITRSDRISASERASLQAALRGCLADKPVFCAFHVANLQKLIQKTPDSNKKASGAVSPYKTVPLRGRRVFAFSGLADNQDFLKTVSDLECVVTGSLTFPDHYPYSDMDIENIVQSAQKTQADCLVTTEKDYVRVAHRMVWDMDLAVIGIESAFVDDDQVFNTFLEERLKELVEKNNHA